MLNLDENAHYFLVEDWCRDGEHEYTDKYIIASDTDLLMCADLDVLDQSILSWQFGGAEWNKDADAYDNNGGLRLVRVDDIKKLSYDTACVLGEYLSLIDFDTAIDVNEEVRNGGV